MGTLTASMPNRSRMMSASCGDTAMTRAAARHMRRSQSNMRSACILKYALRNRIGRLLDVAPPDHGLHVVLKQHHTTHIGKIGRGREEIADHAVELLGAEDLGDLVAHGRRAITAQRKRHRGSRDCPPVARANFERPPRWNIERHRIRMRAVFTGTLQALGLGGIVVGDVMDLVAGMQPLHDLQGPDLTSTGGRDGGSPT